MCRCRPPGVCEKSCDGFGDPAYGAGRRAGRGWGRVGARYGIGVPWCRAERSARCMTTAATRSRTHAGVPSRVRNGRGW
jgi:hypothetical protein